jgi:multidrug efflux system outer membrane protein
MKTRSFLLFVAVLIAGCAVGPHYSRPTLKHPVSYIQSAVYNDTVLQSLIRIALDQNKDLLGAVARVEQSKAILGYNRANLGPFVDYSLRARSTDFGQGAEAANLAFSGTSYAGLGNVNWEIDLWGKLRHANRSAYAQLLASEEDRKSVHLSLVAQVAELYFQLRGLDERLELTRKTYAARREYLRIIALRLEKGNVAELDKLQAEQLAASSEAQQYVLERSLIFVENAINVLLGRPSTPLGRGILNEQQQLPIDIPSGLPSQLLERRPDIRASEQRLIAQTEKVGMAVALRFPSLSLTAVLGVASNDISTLISSGAFLSSVTGQLAGPAFRFNQNIRRVEAEKATTLQYGYEYEQTVLKAFAEVENSLAEVRTYRSEYNARLTQATATERALLLSRSLYDNGYTSFLQVLDAERESYSTQFEKSQAMEAQLIATVKLYKALGGGW